MSATFLHELGIVNLISATPEQIKRHEQNIALNRCVLCNQLATIVGVFDDTYTVVQCSVCKNCWANCFRCNLQRSVISSKKAMKRHNSNVHKKKRKIDDVDVETPDVQNQEAGDSDFYDEAGCAENSDSDDVDRDQELIAEPLIGVKSDSLGFGDRASQEYFQQCHLAASAAGGIEYLVKKSQIGESLNATDYATIQLPPNHAMLQMRIAHLCFLLTRGETDLLVAVMEGCYRVGCEDGYAHSQRDLSKFIRGVKGTEISLSALSQLGTVEFDHERIQEQAHAWSTRIPRSWKEIRHLHLEGAKAIVPNLPIPPVQNNISNHAHVSIIDCIRHFLGHKDLSDIAIIDNHLKQQPGAAVTHCSSSVRAQQILSQSVDCCPDHDYLKSYIILWSDDVEPNRTKSNRGSIWLLTATIATRLSNGHSMDNTYPIAISKKNEDHEPAIRKLEEDLAKLRSGQAGQFYIGHKKKAAKMQFELFAAIQDQPERRDFNCMRAGNGIHTARFGVSADHASIYHRGCLAACNPCIKRMEDRMREKQYGLPIGQCKNCLNWDVFADPEKLGLYPPPKRYPLLGELGDDDWYRSSPRCRLVTTSDGHQLLKPFQITYDSLKESVDFAHNAFCDHGWSQLQCISYLSVEGMDDKFIDTVLQHANRCLSLRTARNQANKYGALIEDANENPAKYQKLRYPAPWVRPTIGLNLHPDVIMHLLFLGVVKTVVMRIQSWLALQMKKSSFFNSTRPYLEAFNSMTMEWIPILPYRGGKLGGWVSENFLAFSRIMPWFYQNIAEAVKTSDEDEPPESLPQKSWTNKQNKFWLRVRTLDADGKKSEVAERVANYLNQANPPVRPPEPLFPPAAVQESVLALNNLLQCVMKTSVTPLLVNRTRYAVRLFLSQFDAMCAPMNAKTPTVLSSYNFICTLNLPSAMETFGPLRCLWEGGPRGEGFARFAKPFMTAGVRQQHWQVNLLTRLLRAKTFDFVLKKPATQPSAINSSTALRDRKGNFHKYDAEFTFQYLFTREKKKEKKPVSVVLLGKRDGGVQLCGVVGNYESIMMVSLSMDRPNQKFGLFYYKFEVPKDGSEDWNTFCSGVTRIGFGLLLPVMEDIESGRFALISSNWEILSPSSSLSDLLD